MSAVPVDTLLIANRGEIARRILRTCRLHDIRTVVVFTREDAAATFVREADVAVGVSSYLAIDEILAAAAETAADAVHPGYGFLAENADFARAVQDAGLAFVGPSADVIALMGRKDRARGVALAAGVPVAPQHPLDAVPADAYPVLVKAAAGGWGKGMRVVRSPDELADAVAAAGREAVAAFGDGTLLVERYLERGRHVEVQVVADLHGSVLHLGTRDCSTQRRHQKVLEEAPAPDLPDHVRAEICRAAIALCRAVEYVGAGTVEFLVAGDDAYFLEMNTRLQVEHPVTEAVTGIDLVAWQLLVAAGEPLPSMQHEVVVQGHAMEVRVYAEDPTAGFLPQTGRISRLEWPDRARVEADLAVGRAVGTSYDPMLAKIVVAGSTREDARRRLVDALDRTVLVGVTTNLGFLRRLAASKDLTAGPVTTDWLESDAAAAVRDRPPLPSRVRHEAEEAWNDQYLLVDDGPFVADGWRLGDPVVASVPLEVVDGPTTHDEVVVVHEAEVWRLVRPDPMRRDRHADGAASPDVVAPMPGTVLAVDVEIGDEVVAGTRVAVLEAMKMELPLTAPHDGTVDRVAVGVGDRVGPGDVLVVVAPA